MRGKDTGVPVLAKVPHGWAVLAYAEREQPYTLCVMLPYDRHKSRYKVVRFCWTLGEAERASSLHEPVVQYSMAPAKRQRHRPRA